MSLRHIEYLVPYDLIIAEQGFGFSPQQRGEQKEFRYEWYNELKEKLLETFGDNLISLRAYGSGGRKEAKKTSDFDALVIIKSPSNKKIDTSFIKVEHQVKVLTLNAFEDFLKIGEPILWNNLLDSIPI